MLKAMLTNTETGRACVTTAQAAEQSGLSKVYLARLLREGILEGFRLAHDWFIYIDSLEHFLAIPRKSGPKGPMKKERGAPGKNRARLGTPAIIEEADHSMPGVSEL